MDNKELLNKEKELSVDDLDKVTGGVVVTPEQNLGIEQITPDRFAAMLPNNKAVPAPSTTDGKPDHPQKLVHPGTRLTD